MCSDVCGGAVATMRRKADGITGVLKLQNPPSRYGLLTEIILASKIPTGVIFDIYLAWYTHLPLSGWRRKHGIELSALGRWRYAFP